MVKLTRIYTRGGDKGQTSLGDGRRVAKHDLRVAAYGTLDEANAVIGLARLHSGGEADAMLARIQNDLFDLGGDLCVPERDEGGDLRIVEAQVERLEREIDAMNAELAPSTPSCCREEPQARPGSTWPARWCAGRSGRSPGWRRRRRSTRP